MNEEDYLSSQTYQLLSMLQSADAEKAQQGCQVCPPISIMVCKAYEQALGKTPRRGTSPAVALACHPSLELGT